MGVRYLHEIGFIERELEDWYNVSRTRVANLVLERDTDVLPPRSRSAMLYTLSSSSCSWHRLCASIVPQIMSKICLLSADTVIHRRSTISGFCSRRFDGTPPPHFYGELVKTDEGCDMLEDCGHFSEFAEFIRENMYEDQDADTVAQLKSVLWAVVSADWAPSTSPVLSRLVLTQSPTLDRAILVLLLAGSTSSIANTSWRASWTLLRSLQSIPCAGEFG